MNIAFYEAIARLPLGTAVAIEFCGPVAVAAAASRRPRDVAAVLFAAVGVLLIADVRWSDSPSGLLWALGAATMWAAYIVLGKRVASGGNGVDDMTVGFAVAAVVLSPLLFAAGTGSLSTLADPLVLVLAVGVGVLSSVVPYVLDQVVLRGHGDRRGAGRAGAGPDRAGVPGHRGRRGRRGAPVPGRGHPGDGGPNGRLTTLRSALGSHDLSCGSA
jgi:inner membrane transporter RhtA